MMFKKLLFIFFLMICCTPAAICQERAEPLKGKIIFLDAGHGGTAETDHYRVGPSGEREEWINLRVALLLQEMLEQRGATVLMSRKEDENISLTRRAEMAKEGRADVFLSIHHNATADPKVNFPIVYFHGYASENLAGVALGAHIGKALKEHLYQKQVPVSVVSDHTIFSADGASVLRNTYGIPGVIAEASFFTDPEEETRLRDPEYNNREARAYVAALEAFLTTPQPAVLKKNSIVSLPPFKAFQEAERMSDIAKGWYQDYLQAKELMKNEDKESLQKAYDLFTRSVRSFPDSYVASICHRNRATLLNRFGKPEEAEIAALRAEEFYVDMNKE